MKPIIYEIMNGMGDSARDVKITVGTITPIMGSAFLTWIKGFNWTAILIALPGCIVAVAGFYAAISKGRYYDQRRRHESEEWELHHPHRKP